MSDKNTTRKDDQVEDKNSQDESRPVLSEGLNDDHDTNATDQPSSTKKKHVDIPSHQGGKLPSFDALRKEHDMIIVIRIIMLIAVAVILMIPIPIAFVGMKFVIFAFLAYASIYNEIELRKESAMRGDKFSKRAHTASYAAFIIVLILFITLCLMVGSKVNMMVDVTNQAVSTLQQLGYGTVIIK
jgi:hypothetical protein